MILLILAVMATVAACGEHVEVNEFQKYVDTFQAEARLRGKDIEITRLIIEYGDPSPMSDNSATVGVCWHLPLQVPRIVVDREFWDMINDDAKEQLIFHEMGHCVLGQDHRENSVMEPSVLDPGYYRAHRTELLDEFFNFKGPDLLR